MGKRFCAGCGRGRLSGEFACPKCDGEIYADHVAGTADALDPSDGGELAGVLGSLLLLPPGRSLLIYGDRGTGKSSLALTAFDGPIYISSEMGPSLILAYAKRLKRKVGLVSMSELETAEDLEEVLNLHLDDAEIVADVIIDSLTGTGRPLEAWTIAREYAERHGVRAIGILQTVKSGRERGDARLGHDADAIAEVRNRGSYREIIIRKSRFSPETSGAFRFTSRGQLARPDWDRYYSIEGDPPGLWLEPYPNRKARYAAPLKALEALRRKGGKPEPGSALESLPEPPCAVAAEFSPLYPGGWIEPGDIDARRAFAERSGIPFWSPRQVKAKPRREDGHEDGS